jgi:hypothetical protein
MGLDDLYPFTLSEPVIDKLRFVHHRVQEFARPPVGKSTAALSARGCGGIKRACARPTRPSYWPR